MVLKKIGIGIGISIGFIIIVLLSAFCTLLGLRIVIAVILTE